MNAMTIGKVAAQAGVGKETIRYYQRLGLIARPSAREGGYPLYDAQTVERLRFIRQAQAIGFSLREVGELLALRADPTADCASVRERALAKLDDVQCKLAHLAQMQRALQALVAACPGRGGVSDCSILEAMQQQPAAPVNRPTKPMKGTAMKQFVFDIDGMHCAGCAGTVEALLAAEPGVQRAAVSYEQRQARVLLDEQIIGAQALATALARAGYRLTQQAS